MCAHCIAGASEDTHTIDPIKIHDPVKEGVLAEFERKRKVLCGEFGES